MLHGFWSLPVARLDFGAGRESGAGKAGRSPPARVALPAPRARRASNKRARGRPPFRHGFGESPSARETKDHTIKSSGVLQP